MPYSICFPRDLKSQITILGVIRKNQPFLLFQFTYLKMHTFWQWLLKSFPRPSKACSCSKCHSLAREKRVWVPQGPALFWKQGNQKPRACGCKTAPGKQVEAVTTQRGCFLVLFSPVYFSLKQSLLSTKVCRELARAAVVP